MHYENTPPLPIYTVLVPLYQEPHKLPSIVAAICALNYPKDKLDVKIIIEADDILMKNALKLLTLPRFIEVIIVPFSLPRTKPKALNYAVRSARGKYLTIYDAEDRPEPEQLVKAVVAFAQLTEEYACLQAELAFYNKRDNLLTRWFSFEYGIWFGSLLKGMSYYQLPIPLGGTSNHFKLSVLKEVGFWDAYNVTEDAELGLRLAAAGYKTCILDSVTLEESPDDFFNWLRQRARWIKGYTQTSLVFCFSGLIAKKTLSNTDRLSIVLFVYILPYIFLSMPWFLLGITAKLSSITIELCYITGTLSVTYGYFAMLHYIIYKEKTSYVIDSIEVWRCLTWPLYGILISIGSYVALWELATNPFYWNKTRHGPIDLE